MKKEKRTVYNLYQYRHGKAVCRVSGFTDDPMISVKMAVTKYIGGKAEPTIPTLKVQADCKSFAEIVPKADQKFYKADLALYEGNVVTETGDVIGFYEYHA